VEVDRDVGFGFRPECDVCVHVLLFTGLHLSPRPPREERERRVRDRPNACKKRNGGKVHAWAVAAGHLPSLP
jgi:hypothetical protein